MAAATVADGCIADRIGCACAEMTASSVNTRRPEIAGIEDLFDVVIDVMHGYALGLTKRCRRDSSRGRVTMTSAAGVSGLEVADGFGVR